ncbi:hypothetical protein LINPERHAP2_LOCUS3143 [Linum perenne]
MMEREEAPSSNPNFTISIEDLNYVDGAVHHPTDLSPLQSHRRPLVRPLSLLQICHSRHPYLLRSSSPIQIHCGRPLDLFRLPSPLQIRRRCSPDLLRPPPPRSGFISVAIVYTEICSG